jgi:hypothetical protein
MDAGTQTSLPPSATGRTPLAVVHPAAPRPVRIHVPRAVVALLVALAALNLADLITTRLVLDRGGAEGNPLMRPLVEGLWPALSSKALCLVLIAALAVRCPRPRWTVRLLAPVTVWYGLVVAWNVVVLSRLG